VSIVSSGKPTTAGIGLRLSHIAEMAAIRPPVGFLEIHPENFLANPHAMQLLIELSRHYPISVHSVGVSVGSATGLDRAHLRACLCPGGPDQSSPYFRPFGLVYPPGGIPL
jgi:uncharacterized protein (UPF0276 family)